MSFPKLISVFVRSGKVTVSLFILIPSKKILRTFTSPWENVKAK